MKRLLLLLVLASCKDQPPEYKTVGGVLFINDPFCYQVASIPVKSGNITTQHPIYNCRDNWQPIDPKDTLEVR